MRTASAPAVVSHCFKADSSAFVSVAASAGAAAAPANAAAPGAAVSPGPLSVCSSSPSSPMALSRTSSHGRRVGLPRLILSASLQRRRWGKRCERRHYTGRVHALAGVAGAAPGCAPEAATYTHLLPPCLHVRS